MLAKILIVEDQELSRLLLTRYLEQYPDFVVRGAATIQQAVGLLRQEVFDCVVLDLNLKDAQGMPTFEAVKAQTVAPIVVYSGYLEGEIKEQLIAAGACEIVEKNIATEVKVRDAIAHCIAQKRGEGSESIRGLLVPKSTREAAITWMSSGVGGFVFSGMVLWNAYEQFIATHSYTPPEWALGIVMGALGVSAYGLTKRR